MRRVCDLHTDLMPSPSPALRPLAVDAPSAAGHACSRVYLPTAESVPAARHFVVDVLRSWGHDALSADAALIVSELATNALRHAASPFRAVVDRRRGGLRIGVEDATDTPLERRAAAPTTSAGAASTSSRRCRGAGATARSPGGKVVWAELPLDPSRSRAG